MEKEDFIDPTRLEALTFCIEREEHYCKKFAKRIK
jgi:hypothetical protein